MQTEDPQTQEPLHCPVHRIEVIPRDSAELVPLLAHLRADAPIASTVTFPCGMVLPDGRLDLCKQALGPVGCRRLVKHNRSIEVLYLGCNNIDAEGIAPLAEALSDPRAVVSGLWLKRNPLGPDGAFRIAGLLRRNASLRVLDLVNTWPGDGLAHILDALSEGNRTVQRVYLGGNGLKPADAPRLAALLRASPSLHALMLSAGHLRDEGALALADALLLFPAGWVQVGRTLHCANTRTTAALAFSCLPFCFPDLLLSHSWVSSGKCFSAFNGVKASRNRATEGFPSRVPTPLAPRYPLRKGAAHLPPRRTLCSWSARRPLHEDILWSGSGISLCRQGRSWPLEDIGLGHFFESAAGLSLQGRCLSADNAFECQRVNASNQ